MKISLLLGALLLSLSSCANHLKDFAQQAETVSLNVVVVDTASIDWGGSDNLLGSIVSAAVTASADQEKMETRLQTLLGPKVVESMIVEDASKRLGTKIPFAVASGKTDGQLEIIVNQYGISKTGSSHSFTIDYTISVFNGFNGEKVYSRDFFCADDTFHSFVRSPGNIFNTAATIAILNKLTDEQVRASLKSVVEKCTQEGLSAMRDRATN